MRREDDPPTYLPSPEEIELKKAEFKAAHMERLRNSAGNPGDRTSKKEPVRQFRNVKLPPL